jgi:uncharacterized membrane protein YphA (DoxX/SURF4 family)
MTIAARIAGPLLGTAFLETGLEALTNPGGPNPDRPPPSWLTTRVDNPDKLVRAAGAVQMAAGALLVAGKFRRTSAVVLLATIVPATYVGRRFWDMDSSAPTVDRSRAIARKAGLVGALVLAMSEQTAAPARAASPSE